jgi:hypothetical protein
LSTIGTWLRDPLAFFGGRWSEYLIIAFVAWLAATMLTHRVAQFNAAPPHAGVRDLRIDQAVLLNETRHGARSL